MAADFTIRPYKSGDEKEIVELLIHGFQGWPKFDLTCSPLDHWTWKFIDNPFHMNIIFVAEKEKKIIGCTHSTYSRIKIGKTIKLCSPGADSVVHEQFRKYGVHTKMYNFKKEAWFEKKIGISYATSTNKYVLKTWKKSRREPFPHPVINLIRIRDIDLFITKNQTISNLRKHLLKYAIHLAKLYNWLENVTTPPREKISGLKVTDMDRFDERIDAFWERIKDSYSFITERTQGYLNWRYRDPRGGIYAVKQAVENGIIVGYMVLRVNRYVESSPQGYIVDLCTLKTRLDCAEALVNEAVRFFDDAGVNVVNYWGVKGHPYMGIFKRFGFLDSRNKIGVGYDNININEEEDTLKNLSPDKILFQYGDSDWI